MKKDLLLKQISGEATPQQEREVLNWVSENPENKKYYMDLKNLWIAQTMPQSKATVAELEMIRKRTTRNIEERYRRRGILMYLSGAIAAAAVVALVITIFAKGYIDTAGGQVEELVRVGLADIPNQYKHEVYTEKGVKAKVILPDSSVVWLNSESRIIYPDKFIGKTREVEFSGEAFFQITKDTLVPMFIKTNKDFTVKVLGTSFNLKSYDNDKIATTTLYTGIVDIIAKVPGNDAMFETTRLVPNEICIVTKDQLPVLSKVDDQIAQKEAAWREGKMVFESAKMEEVVKMLRRWHGVEIIIENPQILDYKITADFESESIVQIAEMLRYCALIDYRVVDGKVYFRKR